MVEAEELRIGNYILGIFEYEDDNEEFFEATEICKVLALDSIDLTEYRIWVESENIQREYWDRFTGIPLTEQWLLDFGFENTQIGLFQIKVLSRGSINIHTNRRDIKFVELGTTGHYLFGVVDVKFVHQLQNLYFALTGEELKRKEVSRG